MTRKVLFVGLVWLLILLGHGTARAGKLRLDESLPLDRQEAQAEAQLRALVCDGRGRKLEKCEDQRRFLEQRLAAIRAEMVAVIRQFVPVEGFRIQRAEVTQSQWMEVMGAPPGTGLQPDCSECPVVCTWYDAIAFANRRSLLEGLEPAYLVRGIHVRWNREANGYRLPTEAEWETARQAGGIQSDGWFRDNSDGLVHEACSMPASSIGLCDMFGNVAEWMWDAFRPDDDSPVASGQLDYGPRRLIRGGSALGKRDGRYRGSYAPVPGPGSRWAVGFRLVQNGEG